MAVYAQNARTRCSALRGCISSFGLLRQVWAPSISPGKVLKDPEAATADRIKAAQLLAAVQRILLITMRGARGKFPAARHFNARLQFCSSRNSDASRPSQWASAVRRQRNRASFRSLEPASFTHHRHVGPTWTAPFSGPPARSDDYWDRPTQNGVPDRGR